MPPKTTKAPAKKAATRTMSDSHKAALAQGRAEGRAVARYLDALEAHKPKRGRKRTPESISNRLEKIEQQLAGADPLTALRLRQERTNLRSELGSQQAKEDLSELEEGFVSAAKGYSQRKGISYATWRESGVPAVVLKRAGISRGA